MAEEDNWRSQGFFTKVINTAIEEHKVIIDVVFIKLGRCGLNGVKG